jgi:uncharacterized protein YxjI
MGIFDYDQYKIEWDHTRSAHFIKDPYGEVLGKINLGVLYLGKIWHLYDASGAEIGRMENKTFAIQPNISILDQSGAAIAILKGNQTTFHGSEYWFENAEGVEILRAKGEAMPNGGQDFKGTNCQILDTAWSVVVETKVERDAISVAFLSQKINRQMALAAIACIDDIEHQRS